MQHGDDGPEVDLKTIKLMTLLANGMLNSNLPREEIALNMGDKQIAGLHFGQRDEGLIIGKDFVYSEKDHAYLPIISEEKRF